MTVCIAALADDRQKLYYCTDRMITSTLTFGLTYEYETDDVRKVYQVGSCKVLVAGNSLFAHEIVTRAKEEVSTSSETSIDDIAEMVRSKYQEFRLELITRKVLEPRGLTLEDYYSMHQRLNMAVVQEVRKSTCE